MCLSTVLTTEHQVVCKNVAAVTQKDGKLVFTDIMGIPTVVAGSIEKIDLTLQCTGRLRHRPRWAAC